MPNTKERIGGIVPCDVVGVLNNRRRKKKKNIIAGYVTLRFTSRTTGVGWDVSVHKRDEKGVLLYGIEYKKSFFFGFLLYE